MKKHLLVVAVLVLALLISPLSGFSGIEENVFASATDDTTESNENAPATISSGDATPGPSSTPEGGTVTGGDATPSPSSTPEGGTPSPNPTPGGGTPSPNPTPGEGTPSPSPTPGGGTSSPSPSPEGTPTPAPTKTPGTVPGDATPTPIPTNPPADQIVNDLLAVLEENENKSAAEVVKALKAAVGEGVGGVYDIRDAMTESKELCDKIEELEKSYAQWNLITVRRPEVSNTAKQYVDAGKVSVVGAAFSVNAGATVNLHMSETENPKELPDNARAVQLDIKLYSNGNVVEGNLDMPVTITMPVPKGIDVSLMVIRHYKGEIFSQEPYKVNEDGTITFGVADFSTFVFVETFADGPCGGESAGNKGGNMDQQTVLADRIAAAAPGTVVKITKDQYINTLSNSIMKQLVKRGDVALEMEYSYNGADYHIVIPAGMAVDNDIQWYGPLYLSEHYNVNAADAVSAAPSVYVVQRGDTLTGIARKNNTTVAKLAAVNPQIRNINRIVPRQIITIQ